MSEPRRMLIGGEWVESSEIQDLRSPYSGETIAEVCRALSDDVERAIGAAAASLDGFRVLPAYERSGVLARIAEGIRARADDLARTISLESGKTIKDARAEVARSVHTFQIAAEEALRMEGDVIPLDRIASAKGRMGITQRFPIGAIAGIAPFNFPLNLVAHKVAPCIASGNTMVLKPASQTPLSALNLGEIAMEAGLPRGVLNVIPASSSVAAPLVEDDRVRLLTFTGSADVGWGLRARCGRKKVSLELGGNAGVVIDSTADLEYAAGRVAVGGYSNSGQSCISVQRVFVASQVYTAFLDMLMPRVESKVVGDPLKEETDVGPLITLADAERVESWIQEAVADSAKVRTGGWRENAIMWPTILTDTQPQMKVNRLEVFAPVITVEPVADADEGIRRVNDSRYGLQAGIFTNDLNTAFRAFRELEVGGVTVNDVPTWRADNQPYGGVKDSGMGREGVRYAMEEMTELRIMIINSDRS